MVNSNSQESKMVEFLAKCQAAYHQGTPLISDEEFDALAEKYNFYEVGAYPIASTNKANHLYDNYTSNLCRG